MELMSFCENTPRREPNASTVAQHQTSIGCMLASQDQQWTKKHTYFGLIGWFIDWLNRVRRYFSYFNHNAAELKGANTHDLSIQL